MINGQSAGKDLAYLYGVYMGDGSITKRSDKHFQFAFETIDEDFMDKVIATLFTFIKKTPTILRRNRGKNRNDTFCISVSNIFFKDMYESTAGKKLIPEWILNGDKHIKMAFLQGCLDSDGYVSVHHNKKGTKAFSMGYCKGTNYVHDIFTMMKNIGLTIGLPKAKEQKSNRICFYITINIKSWIKSGMKFSISRKNKRIQEYIDKFCNPQRLYVQQEK